MKILFAGGGTLGPVTPLIAVLRRLRVLEPSLKAVWVGTPQGLEREVVAAEDVKFVSLPVAKFPRYLSLETLAFPFKYWKARQTARALIAQERPDLVVSVGGYMGVPVIRAARQNGIPCAIHQLDAEPGLSNRVVAKLCQSVTTSFAYDKPPFRNVPSQQAPTPCRFAGKNAEPDQHDRLNIFILGGGTGALGLNGLVSQVLPDLLQFADIVHLTGKGKSVGQRQQTDGYVQTEFFDERAMLAAYTNADIVIARAGLGTLSECAALKKPTILVPMPWSHQEKNAEAVKSSVIIVGQEGSDAKEKLLRAVRKLKDQEARQKLGSALCKALPTDNGSALAERWVKLAKKK